MRTPRVCSLLFLLLLTTPSFAEKRVSPIQNPRLEIRNQSIEVRNNASQNYRFGLSVLGFQDRSEFVPLLAIAIDSSGHGPNSWMAVWNLNVGGTTIVAQAKAMVPNLWGILGGKKDHQDSERRFCL